MIKVNGFNLKGFKSMMGHEGYIMRGTLMKNGKAISEFFDDGNGGGMRFNAEYSSTEDQKRYDATKEEVFNLYKNSGLFEKSKDENFYRSFIVEQFVDDIASFQDAVKSARKLAKKHGTKDAIVVASICDHQGFNTILYTAFASKIFFNQKKFEKEADFGKFYKFKRIFAVVEDVCNTNVNANIFTA